MGCSRLQPILNQGLAADGNGWLREVPALTRWSEPGDPRGHWMRLFACTALLRAAPAYRDPHEGECDTVAQFTASAIESGQEVTAAAASVLAWQFLAYPGSLEVAAFLSFAILLLAVSLERPRHFGPWLKELAAWVVEQEARVRDARSLTRRTSRLRHTWLLDVALCRQLREPGWRSLAHRILARPERPHPPEVPQDLQLSANWWRESGAPTFLLLYYIML